MTIENYLLAVNRGFEIDEIDFSKNEPQYTTFCKKLGGIEPSIRRLVMSKDLIQNCPFKYYDTFALNSKEEAETFKKSILESGLSKEVVVVPFSARKIPENIYKPTFSQ